MRADPQSPEGIPTDATLHFDYASPASPDVIININADSTAAFAAWAMGSSAGEQQQLTGELPSACPPGRVLPSIREEEPSACSPEPNLAAPVQAVTPSREITPALRRRSGRASSVAMGPTPVRMQSCLLQAAPQMHACKSCHWRHGT